LLVLVVCDVVLAVRTYRAAAMEFTASAIGGVHVTRDEAVAIQMRNVDSFEPLLQQARNASVVVFPEYGTHRSMDVASKQASKQATTAHLTHLHRTVGCLVHWDSRCIVAILVRGA
jgi:hypothetical protein